MKQSVKRPACLLTAACILLCAAAPAFAAAPDYEKEEIVYVRLDHGGQTEAIYVVNSFDLAAAGRITDRGGYSEVVNLTTTAPISARGGAVSVNAPAGKFYYEGVLEGRETPWEIAVGYTLDGQEIAGDRLAGKSGRLRIDLRIRQREDADAVYRDHYAIQASLSLDSEACREIDAPDATIANVGGQKQLSYIILPGKEADFTVTAEVTDFEMDGVSINMIPLSLAIDDPDTSEIKEKLYELQDGAVELDDGAFDLDDGARQLDDGATELRDGVAELWDGVAELTDGVQELRDGADDLQSGAGDLLDGAGELKDGIVELDGGIGELSGGAGAFSTGLSALNAQSAALTEGSAKFKAGIGQLSEKVGAMDNAAIADMQAGAQKLQAGASDYLDALDTLIIQYQQALRELQAGRSSYSADTGAVPDSSNEVEITVVPNATPVQLDSGYGASNVSAQEAALERMITALTALRDNYLEISGGVSAMTGAILAQSEALPQLVEGIDALNGEYAKIDSGVTAYTEGVGELYDGFFGLTGGINTLADGVSRLRDGGEELNNGAAELYDGTYDLKDGVRRLGDGTVELDDGVGELRDGADELKDGTVELRDGTVELLDGTGELREKTADMDREVDDRINEMLEEYRASDFTPVSFTDPGNTNVRAVQFVMKTAEITVDDEPAPAADEAPAPTLWQRFLNLFSFLWKKE